MPFRVELTTAADDDLDGILERLIANEAGDAGFRWFWRLKETVQSLSDSPRRCALAPERSEFSSEVRQLIYGRKPHQYRILFTIGEEVVTVLHIRHGRRKRLTN
jgi:plasmid stabilization system protein ParE